MPIASKLVYFQRRPAPAAPDDPGPEPPDPRRRPCRDPRRRSSSSSSLSSHLNPAGQEHVPGHQREAAAAKPPGPVGKAAERAGAGTATASSARLHHRSSTSDHGRLPDAVQQARERLLQRLSSVDLSGRRHKTWPSQTVWAGAGLARPVPADACASASSDSVLGGGGLTLTNCFHQPSEPVAASRVGDGAAATEPVVPAIAANADECTPIAAFPDPVSALQEAEDGGRAAEAASDCSICLERCGDGDGDGDGDGLIQLRCGHVFHSACLQRWLRSRADCPYCRATVRARS